METLCSTSVGGGNLFRLSVLSLKVEDTMTIQPIFPSIIRNVHTKNHTTEEVESDYYNEGLMNNGTASSVSSSSHRLLSVSWW